jgi:hypothetical protein
MDHENEIPSGWTIQRYPMSRHGYEISMAVYLTCSVADIAGGDVYLVSRLQGKDGWGLSANPHSRMTDNDGPIGPFPDFDSAAAACKLLNA